MHRDTPELHYPGGPRRLDPQEPRALSSARFGEHMITGDHIVFADDDGVLFIPADCLRQIGGAVEGRPGVSRVAKRC